MNNQYVTVRVYGMYAIQLDYSATNRGGCFITYCIYTLNHGFFPLYIYSAA